MTIRKPMLMGAALATTVALAGCSTANPSSGESSSGTPGVKGVVSGGPVISGAQLNGTQLTAALLSVSDIPVAGFSAPNGAVTDSDSSLTTAEAKFDPSTMSCADLHDLGEAGFGETAMSTGSLVSRSRETVSQTVYQFATATAANAFYATVKANWDSCSTFTTDSQGYDVKLTSTVTAAKAGVGQQDFAASETGTENGTPGAIASTLALDGPDVLLVGAAKLGTATVPTDIDSGTLMGVARSE